MSNTKRTPEPVTVKKLLSVIHEPLEPKQTRNRRKAKKTEPSVHLKDFVDDVKAGSKDEDSPMLRCKQPIPKKKSRNFAQNEDMKNLRAKAKAGGTLTAAEQEKLEKEKKRDRDRKRRL